MNTVSKQASVPRTDLNVERSTNVLEAAVSDLQDAVGALTNNLAPLLGPQHPEAVGKDRAQGESEVAERILSSASRIGYQTEHLRELMARLL